MEWSYHGDGNKEYAYSELSEDEGRAEKMGLGWDETRPDWDELRMGTDKRERGGDGIACIHATL